MSKIKNMQVKFTVVFVILICFVVTGCSQSSGQTNSLSTTAPTIVPTAEPTLSPKQIEEQKIIEQKKLLENQKPGKNLILDDRFRNYGKLYYEKKKLLGVNYALPNGVKVFAPWDGIVLYDYVTGEKGEKVYRRILYSGLDTNNNKYSTVFYFFNAKQNLKQDKFLGFKRINKGDILRYVNSNIKDKDNLFIDVQKEGAALMVRQDKELEVYYDYEVAPSVDPIFNRVVNEKKLMELFKPNK